MSKMIEGLHIKTFGDVSNQAILFIHGFPYDQTLWNDVIETLQDSYYCVSYDIRGFGKSDIGTAQFTMESYAQDVENIVLDLKLKEPILCGFSMGGYIALRANEKQNYKALILANTTSTGDDDAAKLKRSSAILNIDAKGLEPFVDGFLSVAFSEGFIKKEPLKIKEMKKAIMKLSPVAIKAALLAMISRTDTTSGLDKIEMPVLLITSENDKIIPKEKMQNMANEIKNSTLVTLNNSGHMSMIENKDDFISAIKSFLQTL